MFQSTSKIHRGVISGHQTLLAVKSIIVYLIFPAKKPSLYRKKSLARLDFRRGFPWISPDFWFIVGFFPARILHFRTCFAKPPFGALRSLMGFAGSHAKHSTAVFGGTASMQNMEKNIQKWDMFMEISGISGNFMEVHQQTNKIRNFGEM